MGLAEQKKQQQMAEQMQMQQAMQPSTPGKVKVGAEKQSPKAMASPLKTEITNQPQIK